MRYGVISLVAGLAALLAADLAAAPALRSLAVVFLVAGAIAVGIAVGKKRAFAFYPRLAAVSARWAGVIAVAIVIVPTLIIFAAAIGAALLQIADPQHGNTTGTLALGALIALLLFSITTVAALLAIRALHSKPLVPESPKQP